MFEFKKIKTYSSVIERCLINYFNQFGFKVDYNYNRSIIDFKIDDNLLEVKSCFYYRHRSRNDNRKRLGVFKIKTSELNEKIDYYIFVIFDNKISNINYIKSITVKVVFISDLKRWINKKHKDLNKNIYISVKQLNQIKSFTLQQLITVFRE